MISGASPTRGDFRVEPLFHPSDYGRPNPGILDRRRVERYVSWLGEQNYAARNIFVRVPILLRFGQYAQEAGAISWEELPTHVAPFVEAWLNRERREYSDQDRHSASRGIRNPIQQLLRLILPDTDKSALPDPFSGVVPGFFDFLRRERGLRGSDLGSVSALSSSAGGAFVQGPAAVVT
jgi:hypothetical protein